MNKSYFIYFPEKRDPVHFERYIKFIESRKLRKIPDGVYTENHHIVAISFLKNKLDKSLWDKDNVIKLTAREHYIAHLMLKHAFPENVSMLKAYLMMVEVKTSDQDRYLIKRGREYEQARIQYSKIVSNTFKGTYKIYNPLTEEIKVINPEDLELWESKGWKRGIIPSQIEKLEAGRKSFIPTKEYCESISKSLSGSKKFFKINEDGSVSKISVKKTELENFFVPEGYKQGYVNPWRWIHRYNENGVLEYKTIPSDEIIPEGWSRGLGGHWITIYKEQDGAVISKSHFTADPFPEGWYKKKRSAKRKIKRCNPDGTIDYRTISSLEPIPEGWRSISSRNIVYEKHMVWGYRIKEDGTIENKRFTSKENIPEGWFYGRGKSQTEEAKNKISSKNKGYKIMNKEGKEVHIRPEEVKYYLDKGWKLGKPRKPV